MDEKKTNNDTEMNVGMLEDALIDTLKEVTIKFSKDSYICRILTDTIHLINRQKEEISLLKKQPITPSVIDLSVENGLLKAEIERLTKWKDKLQDTKDELEQTLIDTGFKEYCEENKRLTEENTELQQQVNELKVELQGQFNKGVDCGFRMRKFQKSTVIKQAVKDTEKEIFTELLKTENVRKEVVKDELSGGHYIMFAVSVDKIKELAKRKGVEVE